jgi:uncharacterized protein YndB with AHSA1/START domain
VRPAVKKGLVGCLAALVLLVAAPLVVGSLLPREHIASGSVVVAAPPERVFPVLQDYANMPTWWKARGTIERQPGEPPRFREVTGDFRGEYRFEEVVPARRLVVALKDDAGYFGGTWTYELAPEGTGTRVTITEAGWCEPRFFRTMLALFGADSTLKECLASLKSHLG